MANNLQQVKCLLIPYDNSPVRIVIGSNEFDALEQPNTQSEAYSISPTLSMLCHTNYPGRPNPHLANLVPGITLNYPGPCLIVQEVEGNYVDVGFENENVRMEQLAVIFANDVRARQQHLANMKQMFGEANVITL